MQIRIADRLSCGSVKRFGLVLESAKTARIASKEHDPR
jgi:hypothetical protein